MAGHNSDLRISADARDAARECAAFIAAELTRKISIRGQASLAISGGNTPKPMFQDLTGAGLEWSKIHVFWVDERCVPPDHEQSNYKMAKEALLDSAGVPSQNVHRIAGELNPDEAASRYVSEILAHFSLAPGTLPVFDILHRGMGADAHTASLFPGEPLIQDRTGIAAHVWVEKLKMDRVTLLPGVLLNAAQTVLQVSGADKAKPLRDVLYGPDDPSLYPCQIGVRNGSRAVWFLDQAAAANL